MSTRETVIKILSSRVDVSKLTETDPLTSLGLDSLDLVEIMLEIEEAAGIEFEDDKIAAVKTVKDVLDAIEEKL